MYKLTDLYKQIKEEEIELQKSLYSFYCDMDEVLCDFPRRFEQFGGMPKEEYESRFGTEKFWDLIDNKIGYTFWSKMPWMPDGKQLWSYISKYKPYLLSSPSRDNSSRYGKRLWVEENLPGSKLILSKRENKKDYSKKNRILIDDLKITIDEWNSRGGIGILHTTTSNTIEQLKKLGL